MSQDLKRQGRPLPSSVEEARQNSRAITDEVWSAAGWTDLEEARDWSVLGHLDPDGLFEDHLARILLLIQQSSVRKIVVAGCLRAGLSLREVADLLAGSCTPEELDRCRDWFACGFNGDEISAWEHVSEPWECAEWRHEGFGPLDAYNWLADFDYPEDAAQWRDRGFSPARATWYRDAHIQLEEAVAYEVRRADGEDILGEVVLMGGLRGGTIYINQA